MFTINFARIGAAAVCLLSVPSLASTSYKVVYEDPSGSVSFFAGAVPFSTGDSFAGGSAGRTLLTSYAQTSPTDPFLGGNAGGAASVHNTLDLSGVGASRITMRYTLQVGGIDASFGNAAVSSHWALGYTNGFGNLVALSAERSIDAAGVVTQGLYRFDGSGNPGVQISSRFYGRFTYDVVINPFITPTPTIFSESVCAVTGAVDSGAYCALDFGMGIAPRSPAPKAAFASRSMMASPVGGVPEPGSWALLTAGFGIVGAASRRRQRAVVVTA